MFVFFLTLVCVTFVECFQGSRSHWWLGLHQNKPCVRGRMSEYFMGHEPSLGAGQRYSNKLCFVKQLLSWLLTLNSFLNLFEFHLLVLCPFFYLIDLCSLTCISIAIFLTPFLSGHLFSFRKLIFFHLYFVLFHIFFFCTLKKCQQYSLF